MITRRRFLQASVLALSGAATAGFYAWWVEPHWVQVVRRRLEIANLPRDLRGARLVQLSDIHLGPLVNDDYLLQGFTLVREWAPEFVVYTGDFVTHEPQILEHAQRMFQHLPLGKRGTFGILGNHDYGAGWAQENVARGIVELAKDAGVQMLRNELAEVDGLHVAGMDDLWAGRFDAATAFKALPKRAATIALSHNPDTADLPGWEAFTGWILAGHTHGGQCKPPFLPPPLLPVRNRRYSAGAFEVGGGRRMYINRGLGYLHRVRLNVRPEITLFTLGSA